MTVSDGGKGSARRVEDLNKVNEGFDRIFGESKLDKRLREEKEAMNDIYDEDDYDDDETMICPACSGSGEGRYEGETCYKCDGYGEILVNEADYDDY
jgi:RecJ-like exonuclease